MAPVPALCFSIAPSKLQKLQKRCLAIAAPEALWKHELFLLGFEAAIWHFRGATTCFYCASKLPSGTFSAPLKSLKTTKTVPATFDGVSLLCPGTSRGPTSCFCWASKLLSGTSAVPQPVSCALRNCHLARFQHPSKALTPSNPPSSFAMGLPEAPRTVSVGLRNCYWHFRGATTCFYWASIRCYPTFPLTRPSPRCIVRALDSPGLMRRPNKRLAQRAPVRVPLRCLAHYAVLHFKPLAAHAAMVNLPGPQLARHRAVAKRAPVNIFFGCHLAILDIKPVTAGASMVNLPQSSACWRRGLRKTGNCKQTLWQRCVHL